MANNLTTNPLIIDTASATVLLSETQYILSIRWVSKTANAGDDLLVQDANGVTIWESVANGANYVEAQMFDLEDPQRSDGLAITTIDSGTLYIRLKTKQPVT